MLSPRDVLTLIERELDSGPLPAAGDCVCVGGPWDSVAMANDRRLRVLLELAAAVIDDDDDDKPEPVGVPLDQPDELPFPVYTTEARVYDALESNGWDRGAAAKACNVTAATVTRFIQSYYPERLIKKVTAERIREALDRFGGDVAAAARELRCSQRTIRRKLKRDEQDRELMNFADTFGGE